MKYIEHSMPIIETDDFIASDSASNILKDVNRVSAAAATALSAVKVQAVEAAVEDDRLVPADSPELWQVAPDWLPILSGLYDPTAGVLAEGAVGLDGRFFREHLQGMGERMGWGSTKSVGVALTCSGGNNFTDTATSVNVRYPVRIGAPADRARIHIRNRNDRDNINYSGALTFTGLWFGKAGRNASGILAGAMVSPRQVSAAFTTAPDGSEYVTDWLDLDVAGGESYILSASYTCAPQTNQSGIGACWRTANTSDGALASPAGMTFSKTAPLDVWIEWEVAATVPTIAYVTDSLGAGTEADLPVYDSFPAKHALAVGALPVFFSNHGSTLEMWIDPAQTKWTKYAGCAKPTMTAIGLGSNTIFGGTALAASQDLFLQLLTTVRAVVGGAVMVGTIFPRSHSAPSWSATKEAVRIAYNEFLRTLPGGVLNVAELADAMANPADLTSPNPAWVASDGVHFTSYAAAARALTLVVGAPVPGKEKL